MLLVSAVAAVAGAAILDPVLRAQTARRHINLPNRPIEAPFSDAVLVGNTLYLPAESVSTRPPASLRQTSRRRLGSCSTA